MPPIPRSETKALAPIKASVQGGVRPKCAHGFFALALAGLTACTPLPDLGPTPTSTALRAGPAPVLVPLAPLLVGETPAPDAGLDDAAHAARIAALAGRASRLRGVVIDADDRQRLDSARSR